MLQLNVEFRMHLGLLKFLIIEIESGIKFLMFEIYVEMEIG